MAVTSKLGSLLRRLRKEKKISQDALAAASGVARVHIAYLETGKRGGGQIGWETMIGLAKAFGIAPDEFARLIEAEKPTKIQPTLGRPKNPPSQARGTSSATKAGAEPTAPAKVRRPRKGKAS